MKRVHYFVIPVLMLLGVLAFQRVSLSWSLMSLFTSDRYDDNELKTIRELDPDKFFFFLPPLGKKTFFEAVDDLSICRNAEVRKYLYIYLTSGRRYVVNSIERSKFYLETVRDIAEEHHGIPADIILLPLLESGYNPFAVSRSHAVGLWQILGSTAKMLGLQNNRWVDERRDVEKSTRAALKHLGNLHSIFKSWDLALAAYNGGAGYVKRTMIKTGAKTFWELHATGKLRNETAEYVARYAALMVIFKNQRLFGIDDEISKEMPEESDSLILEYPVNIRHVAREGGVSLELLQKLNPELQGSLTPPFRKNYGLRLPVSLIRKLEEDKDKLYIIKFNSVRSHTVRRGECISTIARRYNSTPRNIILLNDIHNPGYIHPGQKLYIPN